MFALALPGHGAAAFIDPFCAAMAAQAMAALVADPAALPPALAARARDGGAALRALAAALFGDDAPALAIGPALARAACPVRIVVGARDAVIASQELSAPDPAIALHRLPGVGHMPRVEASALTARLLSQTVLSAG